MPPFAWLETLRQDLRQTLRGLAKKPALTALAVLSLALAIGANTAIFSLVDAVLLADLPYPQPERLVRLWETFDAATGRWQGSVSVPNLRDWQQSKSFGALGAYDTRSFNLSGEGEAERIAGARVTGEVLGLLGTPPQLGRVLAAGDVEKQQRVVVLSHRLWQSRFHSAPDVLGASLAMDGESFTVIGVMPERFDFPPRSETRLWVPLIFPEDQAANRGSHWFNTVARLAPGVGLATAQSEMDAVAKRLEQQYPDSQALRGVRVKTLPEAVVGDLRPVLLVLWAAVSLVLLIGCGNVANLLLARAAGRRQELAVRAALGAGRGRLMAQLLLESAVLAGLGGVAGLLLGSWAVAALAALPGSPIPRGEELHLDLVVLAAVPSATLVGSIRAAVQRIDPLQPLFRVKTMSEVLGDFFAARQANAILFGIAALLALVLAMIGVYGIVAFDVAQRLPEIGLRMALGADKRAVFLLILRSGLGLALAGALAGNLVAAVASRLLAHQLYQVPAIDPLTYLGATFGLLAVAVYACYLPTRRALAVDPKIALGRR